MYKWLTSSQSVEVIQPTGLADSEKGAMSPFSEQFVPLSKQDHIQLNWEANDHRKHVQYWKAQHQYFEHSRYEGLIWTHQILLNRDRLLTEERSQVRVLQLGNR